MIVRRARAGDLDILAPLFDRYRQFYDQAPDIDRARGFLAERLRREESVVFIAFERDEAIGFVQLYPTFSSISAAGVLVLNDLYVDARRRRGGAGRELVETAIAYARTMGAAGLSLATAIDNRAAQALYEALGWRRETRFVEYGLSLHTP